MFNNCSRCGRELDGLTLTIEDGRRVLKIECPNCPPRTIHGHAYKRVELG